LNSVVLEKLNWSQISRLRGIWMCITVFTRPCHKPDELTSVHTLEHDTFRSPKWISSSGYPIKMLRAFITSPIRATCHPINTIEANKNNILTKFHPWSIIMLFSDCDKPGSTETRTSSWSRSPDNSVGIATGCELDSRSSIPGRCKRFFST
jgi:hypothetical protein